MPKEQGLFLGGSGGGASLAKILIHLGGSSPKHVCIGLAFQIAFTLLSMSILFCYDEFPHWYMAIKIFLDVGYCMSQLD